MAYMTDFLSLMGNELQPSDVEKLKYILKDSFSEDQLAEMETGEDLEITFEQENFLEYKLDRKTLKEVLRAIGRNDLCTKFEIYLAIENHITTFDDGEYTFICHIENENRKVLKQNITSIQCDYEREIEIHRGAGAIGINVFNIEQWKFKCRNYFNRYYKTSSIIMVPSERDKIMDTLSIVCSENESRGFVFKNYDIVKHLEFLGYSKVSLEAKLGITLTNKIISYIAYVEHKNVVLICVKVLNSSKINQYLKTTAIMVKCFLTLLKKEIQTTGVTVIGILLRENETQENLIACNFCHLFSLSYDVFESPATYKEWWSSVENYGNWWDLANPKNQNKLFENLAAEVLCFMAVHNKNLPRVTNDKSQQFKETYFLYTPQQMNILFSGAKHLIIQGSYGSGKSLLGLKKLELISKTLSKGDRIIYVNFDSKSKLHFAMEKNVKEYARIPPRKTKLINSVQEILESPDKLIYVCHNSAGNNLSDILQETINLNLRTSEAVKTNFHFIVEEYDGESLVQCEASKLTKLAEDDDFIQSNIVILAQPLIKKRILKKGEKSYEKETCMFLKLENAFKIVKLEDVLRCSNEICEIIKSTQGYVRNKESVFSTEIDKLKSKQQQQPDDNHNYLFSFSLQGSNYPDQTYSRKEPSELRLPTKPETAINKTISYADINSNKIGQNLDQGMDLDLAFEKVTSIRNSNTGKNKIISKFEFFCEPRQGVDINGLKPILVEFSESIYATSDMAVLSLGLVLRDIISKNKTTVLLHMTDEQPGILRRAIQLFPILINESFFYTENIREFLQKNKESKISKMIFSSNFHGVNGMEFDHVVIVVRQSEYYLKHYLPLAISRCTYDLTFVLLSNEKSDNENDFPGRNREDENKETATDMIGELKSKSLVKEIIVAECKTCNINGSCYCISYETHNKLMFGVHTHSDRWKENLVILANYAKLEKDLPGISDDVVAEAKILDFLNTHAEKKPESTLLSRPQMDTGLRKEDSDQPKPGAASRATFKANPISPAQKINFASGQKIVHQSQSTLPQHEIRNSNFRKSQTHYQLIKDKLIKYENDPLYTEINDIKKRGTPPDHKGLLNPNLMCSQNGPVKPISERSLLLKPLFHHYEQIKEHQKDFPEIRSAYDSKQWFYGNISRAESERILGTYGKHQEFLVRQRNCAAGSYALSVKDCHRIRHICIKATNDNQLAVGKRTFLNLMEIVAYYKENPLISSEKNEPICLGECLLKQKVPGYLKNCLGRY